MADISKISINGTTYDIKDTVARTSGGGTWGNITGTLSNQTDLQSALNEKISKSGDTMTGNLLMNTSGIRLISKSPNYTQDDIPSGGCYDGVVELQDANGTIVGVVQHFANNGSRGICISTDRTVNSSPVYHGVSMFIDGSGNKGVYLSGGAEPWRNALGVSASPVFSEMYNGTIAANTTYTTSSSRKFSNYTFLIALAYGSNNVISAVFPITRFNSSTAYAWWIQGTNGTNYHVSIKYVSDTQFKVDQKGSNISVLWIYGVKL